MGEHLDSPEPEGVGAAACGLATRGREAAGRSRLWPPAPVPYKGRLPTQPQASHSTPGEHGGLPKLRGHRESCLPGECVDSHTHVVGRHGSERTPQRQRSKEPPVKDGTLQSGALPRKWKHLEAPGSTPTRGWDWGTPGYCPVPCDCAVWGPQGSSPEAMSLHLISPHPVGGQQAAHVLGSRKPGPWARVPPP